MLFFLIFISQGGLQQQPSGLVFFVKKNEQNAPRIPVIFDAGEAMEPTSAVLHPIFSSKPIFFSGFHYSMSSPIIGFIFFPRDSFVICASTTMLFAYFLFAPLFYLLHTHGHPDTQECQRPKPKGILGAAKKAMAAKKYPKGPLPLLLPPERGSFSFGSHQVPILGDARCVITQFWWQCHLQSEAHLRFQMEPKG
jgi:hypothetical protein